MGCLPGTSYPVPSSWAPYWRPSLAPWPVHNVASSYPSAHPTGCIKHYQPWGWSYLALHITTAQPHSISRWARSRWLPVIREVIGHLDCPGRSPLASFGLAIATTVRRWLWGPNTSASVRIVGPLSFATRAIGRGRRTCGHAGGCTDHLRITACAGSW